MSKQTKPKYEVCVITEKTKEDPIFKFISKLKFFLNGIGHQYGNDMQNTCDYRISSDFELIFVEGGQNQIEIDGVIHNGNPGDIFVIPPFSKNKIQTTKENPHDNYWIHFSMDPFCYNEVFLNLLLTERGNYCIKSESFQSCIMLLKRIEEEMNEMQPGYKVIREGYFRTILALLIRENIKKSDTITFPSVSKAQRRNLELIMKYVDEHLNQSITVQDIAEHVHLSVSYIFRIFQDNINCSPNRYIRVQKAMMAKIYMETSQMTLYEISKELGFLNYSYFSKLFKDIYGVSPKGFIDRHPIVQNNCNGKEE
ncbi:MAG: AraC family transcriptional regulator [Clostridia bacterium]|nr:AraC family transcriptional regulator [Clostridia bacterium]